MLPGQVSQTYCIISFFVNLGSMLNFSFLCYVEVRKKDVLRVAGGWVGGFGSILQAETCQILILAENPRWSRVWQ